MGSVRPEPLAVENLRRWLLAQLPAKVAAVNATRPPVLESARLGPFTVTSGMSLKVAKNAVDGPFTSCPLTTGSRTAAQIAADVTAQLAGVGSSDSDGRVLLTGDAPTGTTTTSICVGKDTTGANALLGWDDGGERVVKAPLVAPRWKGVCDGWPVGNGPAPDLGPGFWIIISDRASVPVPPAARRDEHKVAVSLEVMWKDTNTSSHRDRTHVSDCVRCIRELLLSTVGRQLGRAAAGDVMFVEENQCVIASTPFSFGAPNAKRMNPLFDMATLTITVRVNERPDLS